MNTFDVRASPKPSVDNMFATTSKPVLNPEKENFATIDERPEVEG